MASPLDYWRAFRGFGKIKTEVSKLMEENKNKPGWKSSEFWLSVAGIVGTAFTAFGGLIPAALAVKIVFGATSVYTVARAVVKITPSTKDDAFVDALAEKLKGVIKAEPQEPPKQP